MSDDAGVEELKDRIAHTRSELGETVEALAAKADVKARASGAVHDAVDSAKAKAHNAVDGARTKAQGAVGNAKARAEGLAGGAKAKVDDVGARARAVSGRHAAPDTGALVVGGDTALVPADDRSAADRRLATTLTATSVAALLSAVIVWLSGRRRS